MSSIPIRKLRTQLMTAVAVVIVLIWAAVAYQLDKGLEVALAIGGFLSLVVLWFALTLLGKLKREEDVEDALRQSEARFRSLTALVSDMYWEQDSEYRFVSATGGGPQWMAKGLDEAVGKRRWDFPFINMTEADWAAHRAVLDARKPFQDLEMCRLDSSGRKTWISVSGQPVFDASGVFTG